MNTKRHTAGFYLDLFEAFDSLDLEMLLGKLERYGIRGNAFHLAS